MNEEGEEVEANEEDTRKKRRRTSKVWEDFVELGNGNKCELCGRVFRGTTSTTNLRNHLEKTIRVKRPLSQVLTLTESAQTNW